MMPPKAQSQLQGALYNWTDDLPSCDQAGVGYQTNLIYRAGGTGIGAVTDYEDRSFYFSCPGECFLYGVLDGHDGPMVADFASQKLPAELLLGQIEDDYGDGEVKIRLKEAFESVAKGFVDDLINEALMEKINLEEQHPKDMSHEDAYKRFPSYFQHLKDLEKKIKGGCSAVVALVHKSRLFVANVGDARALLCRLDPNNENEVGVVQLSTEHSIATISELQRLHNLGLDIGQLQRVPHVLRTTRSLGDWALKGGYKSNVLLKTANDEPILSIPSVHGGEDVSLPNRMFLVLMSKGVFDGYEQATGCPRDQVNHRIGQMVNEEIRRQTTIENVAQTVVDRICRLHKNKFVTSQNQKCLRRGDMTLLLRLFNIHVGVSKPITQQQEQQPPQQIVQQEQEIVPPVVNRNLKQHRPHLTPLKMPEKHQTPSPSRSPSPAEDSTPSTATPGSAGSTSPHWATPSGSLTQSPLTVTITQPRIQPEVLPHPTHTKPVHMPSATAQPEQSEGRHTNTSSEPSLSSMEDKTKLFNRPAEPLETDAEGRIKAYVSFTEFNEKVLAAGGEAKFFSKFEWFE